MTRLSLADRDGEEITIGGHGDFRFDGHGWTHIACDTYLGFGTDAVLDHVCPPDGGDS